MNLVSRSRMRNRSEPARPARHAVAGRWRGLPCKTFGTTKFTHGRLLTSMNDCQRRPGRSCADSYRLTAWGRGWWRSATHLSGSGNRWIAVPRPGDLVPVDAQRDTQRGQQVGPERPAVQKEPRRRALAASDRLTGNWRSAATVRRCRRDCRTLMAAGNAAPPLAMPASRQDRAVMLPRGPGHPERRVVDPSRLVATRGGCVAEVNPSDR